MDNESESLVTTAAIQDGRPVHVGRVAVVCLGYLVAYFVAAWLDLYTTGLALLQPGTTEGNVYATDDAGYSSTTAWLTTFVSAPVIVAFLVFGLVNAHRVSQHWLDHPIRSFAVFYLLPWRQKVLDRSPIHMASFALAFPALRAIAAGNNLTIHLTETGPLGWLVGVVSNHSTPMLGFWLVLGPLFCALAVAFGPLSARVIRWCRRGAGTPQPQELPVRA